jgi:hypothetical protein
MGRSGEEVIPPPPTGKAAKVAGVGVAGAPDATGSGGPTAVGLATGTSDAAFNSSCNADAASTKRASATKKKKIKNKIRSIKKWDWFP